MSSNGSESGGDSGPGVREVAHRLFACEFDDASLEYADSDEERAPKYVITPTGARVNRLFVVGVLTEIERVNEEVVRARVVDPTGAFVVYAGQYQPDALAFLERADPPAFVAVTGKANTFRPEDSDRVYTSVRPESIAEVDAETRDRWTVGAAEHTLGRIDAFAATLEEEDSIDAESGIALAREEYGTTPAYLAALRETALEAARLVAGEVEEVTAPAIAPGEDDGGSVDLTALRTGFDVDAVAEPAGETTAEGTASSEGESTAPSTAETASETSADGPTTDEPVSASDEDATSATATTDDEESDELGDFGVESDSTPEAGAGTETETPSDADSTPSEGPESTGGTGGEMYEFDPEERAEVEAEFDMDFSSGNEVEEPGEADIDAPEPDGIDESDAPSEAETESASEGEEATAAPEQTGGDPGEVEDSDGADTPNAPDEDVDLEDRAMAVMSELADGDGADREEVIERVTSETGADPEAVDDAIESALLSGRCYEPQDGVLKSI
ncbi:hypothetical protein [Halalkalicoccus subterraneus]|uniref:hypothetical protein n=1 Tax=Halalkalicoccus subterraneus TaxID=2675002 RepID=UPI000EFDA0F0|nr:hypothetical protein [Halalkalicoccus subterraneus]